jgi:hypothetical protein
VKHAIYQSERWMCSFFVNSLVLTLLSNRRDQVKPVSDIWVSLSKSNHLRVGESVR